MKVVHICSSDNGGAANAAIRLHLGLLQMGVKSSFLCLHKFTQIPHVYRMPILHPNLHLLQRVLNKIGIPATSEHKNIRLLKKGKEFEIFSFPTSSYDLSEHPLVKEADIVNLHWVGNFLDYPSFFVKIKKPIIWTLHDMNPFQGGFHYLQDVKRNVSSYGKLEEKLRRVKQNALIHVKNIQIVAPSKWLKQESEDSELLGRFTHHHIPYGLDVEIFKHFPQSFARSVFNLPVKKKILLFVSENLHNPRKGIDLLLKAIQVSNLGDNILICAIGSFDQKLEDHSQSIIQIGKIQDERLMALLYSAADVLILPSREDNLPNVMLEAMACGTPVIGFPIGGILDVIEPGVTGILAKDVSSDALREAIIDFFALEFNRELISAFAKSNFDLQKQAQEYHHLYTSLLH